MAESNPHSGTFVYRGFFPPELLRVYVSDYSHSDLFALDPPDDEDLRLLHEFHFDLPMQREWADAVEHRLEGVSLGGYRSQMFDGAMYPLLRVVEHIYPGTARARATEDRSTWRTTPTIRKQAYAAAKVLLRYDVFFLGEGTNVRMGIPPDALLVLPPSLPIVQIEHAGTFTRLSEDLGTLYAWESRWPRGAPRPEDYTPFPLDSGVFNWKDVDKSRIRVAFDAFMDGADPMPLWEIELPPGLARRILGS